MTWKFTSKPVGGKIKASDGEVPRLLPKYHPAPEDRGIKATGGRRPTYWWSRTWERVSKM